jgi:Cu-Zn family superoxide dismutase
MVLAGSVIALCAATASAEVGRARITGTADGSTVAGTVTFKETPEGLEMTVQVVNAPPGKHGFHVHEFGDCGDGGNAAGGHYNPTGVPHGYLPTDGPTKAHAGDFGNIEVGPDGTGTATLKLPMAIRLSSGPQNVAGRAVILHEQPDDFGQPTGNAGGRIGCGAILIGPE